MARHIVGRPRVASPPASTFHPIGGGIEKIRPQPKAGLPDVVVGQRFSGEAPPTAVGHVTQRPVGDDDKKYGLWQRARVVQSAAVLC